MFDSLSILNAFYDSRAKYQTAIRVAKGDQKSSQRHVSGVCAFTYFGIRKLHKKRKYTYIGMLEHAPKTRAIKVEAKTGKFRREAT